MNGCIRLLVLVLFAIPLFAGCGLTTQQKSAISRFAMASETLAEMASSEFVQTRLDVIDMAELRNRLHGSRPMGSRAEVESLLAEPLDRFLTLERVQVRVLAVNALREYAALLHTLATADSSANMRAAAESFTASMGRIGLTLGLQEREAITLGFETVGGLVIEDMRRQAVIAAVNTAAPYIEKLLVRVNLSFDIGGEHWGLAYRTSKTFLVAAADAAQQDADAGTLGQSDSAVLMESQRARNMAERNIARFKRISTDIRNAVEALKVAHAELVSSIEQPVYPVASINAYVDRVERLSATYRLIRASRDE